MRELNASWLTSCDWFVNREKLIGELINDQEYDRYMDVLLCASILKWIKYLIKG